MSAPDSVIVGGRIFDGDSILEGHAVVVQDGHISDVLPRDQAPTSDSVVELEGGLLAPGFIDVQVNGGGGVLFNDKPDVQTLRTIAEGHRRFGTTALLPTLISDEWPVMQAAADAVREARARGVPGIRGIHFEGPYLNEQRRGVHNAEVFRAPDAKALELFSDESLGSVVVTLAPEQVPTEFIRQLAEAKVRVCAGHTAATYEQTQDALQAGVCGFTHLFNAMTPLASRAPGVVGAALADAVSWCGIIVDGYHVHDGSLKLALTAKRQGKLLLVTDAMPSVGAADKAFTLYGNEIRVENGRCTTLDGVLAGSDLDMAAAVRNTISRLEVSPEEALRMASRYPAEFLGLGHRVGRIQPGYDADLVALDVDFNVTETWISGRRSADTKS